MLLWPLYAWLCVALVAATVFVPMVALAAAWEYGARLERACLARRARR